jgi:hypothetical protein
LWAAGNKREKLPLRPDPTFPGKVTDETWWPLGDGSTLAGRIKHHKQLLRPAHSRKDFFFLFKHRDGTMNVCYKEMKREQKILKL